MGIDNIRHPIKDTVKADNSTYSSNKIESLIHSATELPEASIEDAGDVLMVNDEGEWAKGEIIIPQEVPTPTSENIGKVVTVVSDGDEGAEYGLETMPTEVPTPTSENIGKVVTVVSDGDEGAEYGLTNLPDSEIFYFDISLLQASTSNVPDGHDVALTGVTGTSFNDAKTALDAGKRIIARVSVFDQLPTDITFRWTTRDYTIKKGDIFFMDFAVYIQSKTGTPMCYMGDFPFYDYASQGSGEFKMTCFTPDTGTGINQAAIIYLDNY